MRANIYFEEGGFVQLFPPPGQKQKIILEAANAASHRQPDF
jgi:hypothetical protein